MTDKPKSPVEEAAAHYAFQRIHLLSTMEFHSEEGFIAGAKWLAGELEKSAFEYEVTPWIIEKRIKLTDLKRLMGEE